MASIIQIKRSSSTATPASLALGELAYSYADSINGGKLYIGVGPPVDSTAVPQMATRVAAIAGEFYTTKLAAGTPGIAVGNKFLLIDSQRAIDFLHIHGLIADSANISQLDVDSAHISRLSADSAFIFKLDVDSAYISRLDADSAHILQLDVDSGYISRLTVDSAHISQLDVDSAYIKKLDVDSASISRLEVDSGYISQLDVDSAYIRKLDVDSASISRLEVDSGYISQLDVDSAYISRLDADSAHILQLDVDSGYISRLTVDSSHISQLDVDSAKIINAHISQLDVDSGHSIYHSFGIAHSPQYRGPATINIDPFPFNDVAGDVNIVGNLNVQGATTSIKSQTVTIKDTNILLAESAADSAFASGAGITVGGPVGAKFFWNATYNNWETNRLFFNKDLEADSAYFHFFRADSGFVDYLKVNRLEFPSAIRGAVAHIGNDNTIHTDSDFMYDSTNGLNVGKTLGINYGLQLKPTGEIVSYEPAAFSKLRVSSLIPGSILASGLLDSIVGGEILFTTRTDTYTGTNSGLFLGKEPLQDSGHYRIILRENTGVIDATGVNIGSYRDRPVLVNQNDPNTWFYPDSTQKRPFYGISVGADADSFSSTLPINYFRSDIGTDSGLAVRRFPGLTTVNNDSDISILIRAVSIDDSSLFEVHKDGSINFKGELMQNGAPFTGGGLFAKETDDDAHYVARDLSSTIPFGNYGRVAVGTNTPKHRFEVAGGVFSVRGPLTGETGYQATTSGEYSLFKDLASFGNVGDAADSADGSRFLFIPGKAATRGGHFKHYDNLNWDDIGLYSTAFGKNAMAKGEGSFVVGDSSTGFGINDVVLGERNVQKGVGTKSIVLIGALNEADSSRDNDFSVAIGHDNTVGGNKSVLLGSENRSGYASTANENVLIGKSNLTETGIGHHLIGQENVAHGNSGFVFGFRDSTSATLAFAIGTFNTISGSQSFAIGHNQTVSGSTSFGIGNRGVTTGNRSININLRTTTPVPGMGQDAAANPNRLLPGIVQDDHLVAIQGGNVSIGRESDMFDPAISGAGNLFVGGDILYGNTIKRLNPLGGAPIDANVFLDDGQHVLYTVPRNIGILTDAPNAELTVRGDIQVDGSLSSIYGTTDSAIFDSAGTFPGNTYDNMFLYSTHAGLIRAGKINLAEHVNSDLGIFSIGMGEQPYAKGKNSISLGEKNRVGRLKRGTGRVASKTGENSVAIGKENEIATNKNMALGVLNKIDSSSTTQFSVLIGDENVIGTPAKSQSGNYNHVIGRQNTIVTSSGTGNKILGQSNILSGTGQSNYIIGENNTFMSTSGVSQDNIIIGNDWTDSHLAGSNQQYGSGNSGAGKHTIFIGGNTLIPSGLDRGIVIMNPTNFNDSGRNLHDGAVVNKGLNNTHVMIGKTAKVPHGSSSKYVSGFNRAYTLDVHGDVNIDSGATLYIGGLNIRDFIARTSPTITVDGEAFNTSDGTVQNTNSYTNADNTINSSGQAVNFTVSNASPAVVTVTTATSGGHMIAAPGSSFGANSGFAVKFSNLTGVGGNFLNYKRAQDNFFFVKEIGTNNATLGNFELYSDRACTVPVNPGGTVVVPSSTGSLGSYEIIAVDPPVTSLTFATGNTNLTVNSTGHGLSLGDGVRFTGVTFSPAQDFNDIVYFIGPDPVLANSFELFLDQNLNNPLLEADFLGSVSAAGASFEKVTPTATQTSSANLAVSGGLSVGDSARFAGSVYLDQTNGDSFVIGGLSFDSFVARPGGGLIPILEQHLDSAYVQARVTLDNFWAITGGAIRYYQLPTSNNNLGTQPVIINKSLTEADATNVSYKETIGGIDFHKFKLDVTGKTRIDIPSSLNTLLSDPASITAADPLSLDGIKTPIVTTAADGNTVAWPTEEYISKIVTNDYVKNRMNIDSAVIASVIDSNYLKTVISPQYILHNANDSSHFRRSTDGLTLFFNGLDSLNTGVNVAIGAESAPGDFPNSRLYVRGDIRSDSGYNAGGHSVISGFDITPDSEYQFDFTTLAADSYFITHPNSQFYTAANLEPIMLANDDIGMPFGESSIPLTITLGSAPGLDSNHMQVILVTPKDVTIPSGAGTGFDSTTLVKGTLNAAGNGVATGDWAWNSPTTINVREQSIPGYDSVDQGQSLTHTFGIDIINNSLHQVTSLKGSVLQALRLKDSATRIGGIASSTFTSGTRPVLNYTKNGYTQVFIRPAGTADIPSNYTELESAGEKWEETSNTQINVFDSEANQRFQLGDIFKVVTRSKKNTASLTVKGPFIVQGQYDLPSPPINLSGDLTVSGPSVFNTGNATFNTTLITNDSAVFKNGFTVANTANKYAKFNSHINMKGAARNIGWDSTDGNGGNLRSGESAEFYYGPYYPASYDSPLGFILTDEYIGRSFDSNIMRIVDSTYIGTRLITPWNRIGTAPNRQIYYDEEGAVIIGQANTVNPQYDTTTRFALDSGNMLLLSSNIITSLSQHPKKGVVPQKNTGGQIGAGARLMWIPEYGAFRAGYVNGSTAKWDSDEIGLYSQAIGYNTLATDQSIALGYDVQSGKVDITNRVKGPDHQTRSVSIGYNVSNTAARSVGVGYTITNATRKRKSVSVGYDITNNGVTTNDGDGGVGLGRSITVGAGTALGTDITASGITTTDVNTLGIGKTITVGKAGTAIGGNVYAGENSVTIGKDIAGTAKNAIQIGKNISAGQGGLAIGSTAVSSKNGASVGFNVVAGTSALAVGYDETASGKNSVAIGRSNVAGGQSSLAIGKANTGLSQSAVVIGSSNATVGRSSVVIGSSNASIGQSSRVVGFSNTVSRSDAIGGDNTSIDRSTVIGYENKNLSKGAKVVGFGNDNATAGTIIFGSNNQKMRDVYVFGHDNINPDTGTTNAGSLGYIFGGGNRLSGGGLTFGKNNVTINGGNIFGNSNTLNTFGYAFGEGNQISNEGFGFGFGNVVDGTTTKAYAFGETNQATTGGLAIGNQTNASNSSITLGRSVTASASGAIAIGQAVTVSGTNSVGIGLDTNNRTVGDNNTLAIVGGKVGINKTNVGLAYVLEVEGNINTSGAGDYYRQGVRLYNYIQNDVANQAWIRANADQTYVQGFINAAHYRNTMPHTSHFFSDNTTGYIYTTAPRVGIRTTTPQYDVDINGSLNIQSLYWQGDKILDSHQGNQVYLTHQTAQFYISPDSAVDFFDSDYVMARQQMFGFNQGETYQTIIDGNYINNLLDDTLFLDSAEALDIVTAELSPYPFKKNALGRSQEVASTFRLGVGTTADAVNILSVGGPTAISGDLNIGTGGGNSKIYLNGNELTTTAVFEQKLSGVQYLPNFSGTKPFIGVNIGTAAPQYQIDVGGSINVSAGNGYFIDGQDLVTSILDSAFVNIKVQKEDMAAPGKLDSDHFKFIIDSAYIMSVADSAYITSIIDSAYIMSVADSDYIKSIADSAYVTSIIDSDYIKSIADSAYVTSIADSAYVLGIADSAYITSIIDSDYIKSIADSAYVTSIIDSDYIKSIADSAYVLGIADSAYVTSIIDSAYVLGIADSAYVEQIIDSDFVQSKTRIGLGEVDFGPYGIKYRSTGTTTGSLPSASTYPGLVAVTTSDNKARVALGGNWQALPLENTNVSFNTITPTAHETYDLGSPTLAWKDLYLKGNTIFLGGLRLKESNGAFLTTDSLGVATPIDLSGATTKNLSEDSNLYYTDARVDSNITGKDLDMGSNKILYSNVYSALSDLPTASNYHGMFAHVHATGKAYFAHAGQWIDLASGADITTAINNLIDGAPAAMDTLNEFATALGNDANFSTTITALIGQKYDSVGVRTLVDSAYVQARVIPQGIDSSAVSGMIDSAYVTARAPSGGGSADSATILALVDSAYVQARTSGGGSADSATILALVDSAYVTARAPSGGGGSADSATILALVDSAYVQARAPSGGSFTADYSNFRFIATANQQIFAGSDAAGNTLAVTANGIQVYLNGFHLLKGVDYTVFGTTRVVLTTGANAGDDLVITNIAQSGDATSSIIMGKSAFKDYRYRASAGQTVFSGGDLASQTLAIDDNNHQVFLNGIRLNRTEDYVVNSSANTVTLTLAAADSDDVIVQTILSESTTSPVSITKFVDVHTIAPNNGQILIWDSSNNYWAPGVLPAGTDSAAVTGMIDSAYVATRSPANTFTNAVSFVNYYFEADSGQTVFSGNDKNGLALAIDTANYQVFNNGIRLISGVDYTINASANSLTLNGFTADSGDDLVINTLSQTVTTSHIMVGDTFFKNYKFIADSGQTSFTGGDVNSQALAIDSNNFNIFQNGIRLIDSDDFTSNPITNTITLTSPAADSDEIIISTVENKAGNVTVNEQALQGLVDSAYVTARVNVPAAWAEITATPTTMVAGQRLIVDTSTAKTVNLPVAASLGDEIRIIDGTGQAATNNITIGRNGHKIEGSDSDLTIDINRAAFGLVYYNIANGWLFTEK